MTDERKALAPIVGQRLLALRATRDWTAEQAAAHFGVGKSVWHAYEQGRAMLPVPLAIRVVTEFGASLDWLYGGNQSRLGRRLRARLVLVTGARVP